MQNHKEILGQLSRDELIAVVDGLELEVEDRRAKQHLVDAIAKARDVSVDEVLGSLPRDRLKEICRALDKRQLRATGMSGSELDTLAQSIVDLAKVRSGR